ncbi:MAG: ATP-binding protein [Limnochordaceae bacterium]|nr:ATP-binding protein [Limnochordaceae bacterium]
MAPGRWYRTRPTSSVTYERGSVLITTNLPFSRWTERSGIAALVDRLAHRKRRAPRPAQATTGPGFEAL